MFCHPARRVAAPADERGRRRQSKKLGNGGESGRDADRMRCALVCGAGAGLGAEVQLALADGAMALAAQNHPLDAPAQRPFDRGAVRAQQDRRGTAELFPGRGDRPGAALDGGVEVQPVGKVAGDAAVAVPDVQADCGHPAQMRVCERLDRLGHRRDGAQGREERPGLRERDQPVVDAGVEHHGRLRDVASGADEPDRRIPFGERHGRLAEERPGQQTVVVPDGRVAQRRQGRPAELVGADERNAAPQAVARYPGLPLQSAAEFLRRRLGHGWVVLI